MVLPVLETKKLSPFASLPPAPPPPPMPPAPPPPPMPPAPPPPPIPPVPPVPPPVPPPPVPLPVLFVPELVPESSPQATTASVSPRPRRTPKLRRGYVPDRFMEAS
ncbi:hypothetical protein E8A74_11745 [Polyangium fumosum]|uniref:Uncharacterized protein n=1 Tax=Polyangium fumosum TaxID=889272 RepID=A0A4U1JEQ8_9BACT|nr:hypothetical protein E8A74_11745 [Polyangium fumosum]